MRFQLIIVAAFATITLGAPTGVPTERGVAIYGQDSQEIYEANGNDIGKKRGTAIYGQDSQEIYEANGNHIGKKRGEAIYGQDSQSI